MKRYVPVAGVVELKNVVVPVRMRCPGECKGNPVGLGKLCDTCFDWDTRSSRGYVNMNLTLKELKELLEEVK